MDTSSLVHPAAVLDHMPCTKNVFLSEISVLNTVRPLQLDTNVHIFRTDMGFLYWIRDVEGRVHHAVVRVSEPVVGDAVATERVACSYNYYSLTLAPREILFNTK